jgi:hypothetical protein
MPIGRTYYSPPPPAPLIFAKSVGRCEPDADFVLNEINTGHSIINSTPMDITSISMSRKLLFEEFECQDGDDDLGRLISPSFPRWHQSSPGGVGEKIDLDMPNMPSPIKLAMRTGAPTAQRVQITSKVSLSSRPSVRFHEHDFIPIRNDDDVDDEKNEDSKGVD